MWTLTDTGDNTASEGKSSTEAEDSGLVHLRGFFLNALQKVFFSLSPAEPIQSLKESLPPLILSFSFSFPYSLHLRYMFAYLQATLDVYQF